MLSIPSWITWAITSYLSLYPQVVFDFTLVGWDIAMGWLREREIDIDETPEVYRNCLVMPADKSEQRLAKNFCNVALDVTYPD